MPYGCLQIFFFINQQARWTLPSLLGSIASVLALSFDGLWALTGVHSSWECPSQTWPCSGRDTVFSLWQGSAYMLPELLEQSLNAAGTSLSLLGKSVGMWRFRLHPWEVASHAFPGSPPAVPRASFHPFPGLSLGKAWLTHGGTLGWNSLRAYERGFRVLLPLSAFLKLLNKALNSKQLRKL